MANLLKGRLERWNDGKGFGFIRPEQGQKDVFIHISAFQKGGRRPLVGDTIWYRTDTDTDGRIRAVNARIGGVEAVRSNKRSSSRSRIFNLGIGLLVLALLLLAGSGLYFYNRFEQSLASGPAIPKSPEIQQKVGTDAILQEAFRNSENGLQVEGSGTVIKLLADDNEGSRHQRFIVRLNSGQTLLMAHNIDLAARLEDLAEGDNVQFFGEYEWNAQGGVIHWTHRDPNGGHIAGWLKHNGRLYQ